MGFTVLVDYCELVVMEGYYCFWIEFADDETISEGLQSTNILYILFSYYLFLILFNFICTNIFIIYHTIIISYILLMFNILNTLIHKLFIISLRLIFNSDNIWKCI